MSAECGAMLSHIAANHLAVGFLFALYQELDVDRQRAVHLQMALERLDHQPCLTFVVDRSAGVDVVVADLRLERRRQPLIERIGWLDVVVPVDDQRRLSRRVEPLGVDDRSAVAADHVAVQQGRSAEADSR